MYQTYRPRHQAKQPPAVPCSCEHRTVSRDGRIICAKIAQGDNTATPEMCRACPARTADCAHLRFSLCHVARAPLLVRYNGRTEVWSDEAPELRFYHAACAALVAPVNEPRSCATCPLRVSCRDDAAPTLPPRQAEGRVVAFALCEPEPALTAG